ncbi:MAG: alpha/beta fold hydrolase [Acidimicrobiales bacterium]
MARPTWQKAAIAVAGVAAAIAVEQATVGRARRSIDRDVVDGFRMPNDAVRHTIEVSDGGRVHAVESGSGPPIVFLHGVTHCSDVWSWQFEDLRSRHRLIALDHRGHGQSAAGSDPWTIARLAKDVAEALHGLDVDHALIVGHSLGGIVAQQLLLDQPDLIGSRISGVALMATTAGGLNVVPAAWAGVARAGVSVARRGLGVAGRVQQRVIGPNDVAWAMFRFGFGSKVDPTHVELTRRLTAATPLSTLSELLEDVVGFDLRDRLTEIGAPALVIAGSRDLVTPLSGSRLIAERIPDARLEVLTGAGHMVMLERRGPVSELIERFAHEIISAARR